MTTENRALHRIDEAYIDGTFAWVHGSEVVASVNPATGQTIATAVLADREDARLAIAAAKQAQDRLRRTSKAERIARSFDRAPDPCRYPTNSLS